MHTIQLFFLDGYKGDEIRISTPGAPPVVLKNVSSSLLTGLATSATIPVAKLPVEIEIAIPSRSIASKFQINLPFVTISLGPGGLDLHQAKQQPGFA